MNSRELTSAITRISAALEIADEIQRIMETYREQSAREEGLGTPGGLEHMGDVWKLLGHWDEGLGGAGMVTF